MKKLIFTATVILAAAQSVLAQNSVQIHYGYCNPVGLHVGEAFKGTEGFGATVLHKGKESNWAYGASFNRQSFNSSDSYFGKDYSASVKNNNLLFSLRNDYKLKPDRQLYWGIDAGIGINRYAYSKGGVSKSERNNAFTSGFVLGADWFISRNISLDINGSYYRMRMDAVNFNDQFRSNNFKDIRFNIGLKYSFISK